jgi:cyclohexanone monooxygenase
MSASNTQSRVQSQSEVDVVVVGAGFAGLLLIYRLRGLGLTVRVIEAGDNVGGTWYWNRYSGARCDIESIEYSYSFSEELQQDWRWSERYAGQEEILRYINHVADRFALRRDIQLNTRVERARFQPERNRWTVETDRGEVFSARFCVMATGNLSKAKLPQIPGIETFEGKWYHTSNWPKDPVDLSGLRVGVVGTGSTGIQVIPKVAAQAKQLYVFQRTANYSVPLRNRPMDEETERRAKASYAELRKTARECPSGVAGFHLPTRSAKEMSQQEREEVFEKLWAFGGIGSMTRAFNDVLFNEEANKLVADFVKQKMAGMVRDPEVARKLLPTYPIGAKRLCADTGYLDTYNRENVTLVDIKTTPIESIGRRSVTTSQATYDVDALVFATGFDAMTGTLLAIDIGVQGGATLHQLWEDGPHALLGVMIARLPNLFIVTGPGSPSVLSNVVVSVEQHVDWITDCLRYMQSRGLDHIEADEDAQRKWGEHVNEVANRSIIAKAASWYTGANVPGKPRIFMPYMGGVGAFRAHCDQVASDGYAGFRLSKHESALRT